MVIYTLPDPNCDLPSLINHSTKGYSWTVQAIPPKNAESGERGTLLPTNAWKKSLPQSLSLKTLKRNCVYLVEEVRAQEILISASQVQIYNIAPSWITSDNSSTTVVVNIPNLLQHVQVSNAGQKLLYYCSNLWRKAITAKTSSCELN